MARRRLKQLSLASGGEQIVRLGTGERRELIGALADLLLSAARRDAGVKREESNNQRRRDDDHENHR
jgi:hypothetical protein